LRSYVRSALWIVPVLALKGIAAIKSVYRP